MSFNVQPARLGGVAATEQRSWRRIVRYRFARAVDRAAMKASAYRRCASPVITDAMGGYVRF